MTVAVRLKALAPGTSRALATYTITLSNHVNEHSFSAKRFAFHLLPLVFSPIAPHHCSRFSWGHPTLLVFDKVGEGVRFFHRDFVRREDVTLKKLSANDALIVTIKMSVLCSDRDTDWTDTRVSVGCGVQSWARAMTDLIANPLHSDCKIRILTPDPPAPFVTTSAIPTTPSIAAAASTELNEKSASATTASGAGSAEPLLTDIPAHKLILAARSPVFKLMFEGSASASGSAATPPASAAPAAAAAPAAVGWAEASRDAVIEVPFDRGTVYALLAYCYTGSVAEALNRARLGFAEAEMMLRASDLYALSGLTDACTVALARHLSPATLEATVRIADKHAALGNTRLKVCQTPTQPSLSLAALSADLICFFCLSSMCVCRLWCKTTCKSARRM